jgi:glutathione S-transferase
LLELYNAPVSTCSQKVRLVLAEKDIAWQDRRVSFAKHEHISDWYLKLNPNGVLPTLVHNGRAVLDSSVIGEYLEDVFPDRPLRPKDALDRAHMRAWRQFIDEVPTTAIRPPSFNAAFGVIWSHMSDEEFDRYVERLPVRKHFYRRMGRHGFPNEDIQASLDQLEMTLERMERALEQAPWLAGERFTLADTSMTPTIVRMEDLGLDDMWEELPRVTDWYARVCSRPSFAVAFYSGSRTLGPNC